MTVWITFLVIAGGAALLAAWFANRSSSPSHPAIHTEGLDLPSGLVVFTSTDCSDCGALMEMLRGSPVAIREVTYELEAGLFARAGVDGVPLTVAVDREGDAVGQVAGLPTRTALDRLIRSVE